MSDDLKILGIVPARGGSKGLPDKNIRLMVGRPLIGWCAETLATCDLIEEKICSTDSNEIAKAASFYGLDVPFVRPVSLAEDNSTVYSVVKHALNFFDNKNKKFTHVLLLQATSPTVNKDDIRRAVNIVREHDPDTVISVYKLENEHPSLMYYANGPLAAAVDNNSQHLRRQDQKNVIVRTGLLYLTKVSTIMAQKKIIGEKICHLEVEYERSIAIDTSVDWETCEKYMRLK